MGPIAVVIWLVVVLPCAVFAAGFAAAAALNLSMRRLVETTQASPAEE